MMSMTPKQAELLQFIKDYMAENDGVAPSFMEMTAGVGLASKSGIHRMLTALEERRIIRRYRGRDRCIEIVAETYQPLRERAEAILDLIIAETRAARDAGLKVDRPVLIGAIARLI